MQHAQRPLPCHIAIQLAVLLLLTTISCAQTNIKNSDGYIQRDGNNWLLGTSLMERRIRFADGRLVSISLRNTKTSSELQDAPSDEIQFMADGRDASSVAWQLGDARVQRGAQGELQLDISLSSPILRAIRHYVIYPGSAVIREWLSLENQSAKAIRIDHLSFLHAQMKNPGIIDFNYVTGGGNYNGSQMLKSEPVAAGSERVIDSNSGAQPGAYSGFLPLMFLLNRKQPEGLAVGWDYMGHWLFNLNERNHVVELRFELAGFGKDLQPGARIETPKVFIAAFAGGIDDLGNQLLDWQYAYLWDFTNPDYFAKTRWAVDWPDPWVGDGGTPSADNWGRRLALDLRYIDLLRETGTDILWDDAGWYDKWGTWNGPDWKATTDYLRKHDMRWVLWYPTFLATTKSTVGQMHPDWIIPQQDTLEQSIPATADWQSKLLNNSINAWGDYQWRYDIAPAASGNDTDALAADQNFRGLLQEFKSTHPQSGIDACDGGGRWISYDLARFAESGEYTDGGVGPYSAYYTSLIVPPDKLHNVVDYDHTYYAAATDRTHLSMDPTWYRDPGNGPDVEAIRKDWELYHYLVAQGVAGRWSHVFRPAVKNDDAIWYFQRMNRDGSKGVILTKHEKHGSTYYVTSRLVKAPPGDADRYRGNAGFMNDVTTTSAATLTNAVYEDPIDGAPRFYGVPGQDFGPLNVKYQSNGGDASLLTGIVKLGADRPVQDKFFGVALQLDRPMTINAIGQFDPGANKGTYLLSIIRAEDNTVIATATLDMKKTVPDALGFKYAGLPQPVQLDAASNPIVIYPRGLISTQTYEVRSITGSVKLEETGSQLMEDGISVDQVRPGELIFLNLSKFPGSGTDHNPPAPPLHVSKRLGANLGVEGVELSWSASHDDNWLSYYEVRKNSAIIGKSAIGTFFFDHSEGARRDIDADYEVIAIDGDGNRSASVTAQKVAGGSQVYEALGDYSPTQLAKHWLYEETSDDKSYQELVWDKNGYEGRWTGSGMGRIGRIWMQPSAHYHLSRTFMAPASGEVEIAGEIRKDPSAENGASCYVRILRNSEQLWPSSGWAEVRPHYDVPTTYRIGGTTVKAGDKLRFEVKRNGENRADPILWNPKIVYREARK